MKNLTLKIALVAVATILGLNGFAQNTGQWNTTPTVGKYTQSAASPILLPASVTYTDLITVGKKMPFFVWPSAAYNATWNPGATYAVPAYPTQLELQTGVQSDFVWQGGADFASLVPIAGFTKNYVEITMPATPGNYMIQVTETPAGGLCPAAPVYFGVKAIDVPSAAIDASAAVTKFGLSNVLKYSCWAATGDNKATIGLTNNNTDEVFPLNVNVTYKAYNVDALDGSGNIVLGAAIAGDTHIHGIVATAVPSASNPIVVAASGDALVAEQDYPLLNSKITVYEITYNNVNGAISRKSDYLAARAGNWVANSYGSFSYYPTTALATTNYIISFPAPVTGPIYHIANNFAY